MKNRIIISLIVVNLFACCQPSHAQGVSTQLTLTNASGANLFISTLSGAVTASIPFEISGTIDITVKDLVWGPSPPLGATHISLDDADLDLSDESFNLDLGFLGGVSGAITGAGINTLTSNGDIPLTLTNPTDPFEHTFDLGGGSPTELSIDQGLFTYNGTGAVGGLLGSGTVDFSTDPVNATLNPVGQLGLVTQDVYIVGNLPYIDIVVSAPLTFSDTILTDPIDVFADLSGAIVATGTFVIFPEPSTTVLLGIALVSLFPLRRRLLGR